MNGSKFSTKAAVIALCALALLGVLGVAVWIYPPLLLYAMLTVTGVVAYVAVYFIVLSQLRRPEGMKPVTKRGAMAEIIKNDLGQ